MRSLLCKRFASTLQPAHIVKCIQGCFCRLESVYAKSPYNLKSPIIMLSPVSKFILSILIAEAHCFSIRPSSSESRREFLDNIIVTSTSGALLTTIFKPQPAEAIGGKSKVNNKLLGFGLPPAVIPDGLTPLCHIYGTGKNRFPILVTFSHPFDWVVTLPNNDSNGEDGTIQAGEYGKGDTATFFVYDQSGNIKVCNHDLYNLMILSLLCQIILSIGH
jgi:hypothetical protein